MTDQPLLTDLEHRALVAAIANVPAASPLRACLMKQVPMLRVSSRQDNRPYGFYTYFARVDAAEVCQGTDAELNRTPPSAWGVYAVDKAPISFLVYLKDGLIDFMEASTCVSEWPESEGLIDFPADAQGN